MADAVKRRAPNGSPELRRYSSAAKSPTITHRVRGGLYEKLKAEAEKNGLSLSEEIEKRLGRSFDAETLEALLRRVVREEVAVLGVAQPQESDFVRHFRHQEELRHACALRDIGGDALAVMVDAQH